MYRRTVLQNGAMLGASVTLGASSRLLAAQDQIGSMSPAEFETVNMEGGKKVASIEPAREALSDGDAKLLEQIALGGMMQLELSRLARKKATSDDVRVIAKAEVEEQVGLSAKLKEV